MLEDLAVVIEPDASDRLVLRLFHPLSPQGGKQAPFDLPLPVHELTRLFVDTERPGRHLQAVSEPVAEPPRRRSAKEIGEALFQSLATGDVARSLYLALERFQGQTQKKGESSLLRLRLVLDPSIPAVAEVAALPWELLRDPDRGFLARSLSVSVVRFVAAAGRRATLRSSYLPLRVLLAAANPRDTATLDLDREQRGIQEALGRLPARRVQVEVAEARDPLQLFHHLRRGGFHVLHFLGHGDFDSYTGEGCLLFGGPDEPARPVSGASLAAALEDLADLRLVVLNACDTGRSEPRGELDPTSGVAHALVNGGIPAVVAMRFPISDRAAIAFGTTLYEGLADNTPIDWAVAHGRRAIRLQQESCDGIEWAAPALFLQVPDGRILDLHPAPRSRRKDLFRVAAVLAVALGLWGIWQWIDPGFPYRTWLNPPRCPSPAGLGAEAGMRFGWVAPGAFSMGSEEGEPDERPVHSAKIERAYCLGTFEVTWKQWWRVMGEEPDPEIDPDLPVGGVSFEDAQVFVDRLDALEGKDVFGLPTEVQWEYAARAGTTTEYSFGDDPAELPRYGNCRSPSGTSDLADGPARVGSYRANPWGFYDLHGNLQEWVSDPYEPYPGGELTVTMEELEKEDRLRRGGDFWSSLANCRSAARNEFSRDRKDRRNGLRIVRTAVQRNSAAESAMDSAVQRALSTGNTVSIARPKSILHLQQPLFLPSKEPFARPQPFDPPIKDR